MAAVCPAANAPTFLPTWRGCPGMLLGWGALTLGLLEAHGWGQEKHSWASPQVPQGLLHRAGSHCLRHLIMLHSCGGVCIALTDGELFAGAREGRSLGLDMSPAPQGRNHCLSAAILERCFRCGFSNGDSFTLVEATPKVCHRAWCPQHLPSRMALVLPWLTAVLLAASPAGCLLPKPALLSLCPTLRMGKHWSE